MKNILLAISGLTPQIISETFYALTVQRKIAIDEIYIVTTKKGYDVLLARESSGGYKPFIGVLNELCEHFKINKPTFSEQKHIIIAEEESFQSYDMTTDKDNILFPNKIAELLKELTVDNNNAIYASLAGGRKSMSAHLALNMSIFARQQDKLFHILTSKEFESKNYYPMNEDEEKALVLVEIPFVKLRSVNDPILKRSHGIKYSDLVEQTQKKLENITKKLIVDLKNRKLIYGDIEIALTTLEISFYALFVLEKKENNGGFVTDRIYSPINEEDIPNSFRRKLLNFMLENFPEYVERHGWNDPNSLKSWVKKGNEGMEQATFRKNVSAINNKINKAFNVSKSDYNFFKISSYGRKKDNEYYIAAPKSKLAIKHKK